MPCFVGEGAQTQRATGPLFGSPWNVIEALSLRKTYKQTKNTHYKNEGKTICVLLKTVGDFITSPGSNINKPSALI